jgi:hypothetical protein
MGKTAGSVVMVLTGVVSLMWIGLLTMPWGWHHKNTLVWNFNLGLRDVEIKANLLGHAAILGAKGIDWMIKKVAPDKAAVFRPIAEKMMHGSDSIQYYRDQFCIVGDVLQESCTAWEHLHWGSWIMLFTGIITIICLGAGVGFQYHYWSNSARWKYRQVATGFLIAAPIVSFLGLGIYTALTQSFRNWMSGWFLSADEVTFDAAWFFAWFVCLTSGVPALIQATCAKETMRENIHEATHERRKLEMYSAEASAQYPQMEMSQVQRHSHQQGYNQGYDQYNQGYGGYGQQPSYGQQGGYDPRYSQQQAGFQPQYYTGPR